MPRGDNCGPREDLGATAVEAEPANTTTTSGRGSASGTGGGGRGRAVSQQRAHATTSSSITSGAEGPRGGAATDRGDQPTTISNGGGRQRGECAVVGESPAQDTKAYRDGVPGIVAVRGRAGGVARVAESAARNAGELPAAA